MNFTVYYETPPNTPVKCRSLFNRITVRIDSNNWNNKRNRIMREIKYRAWDSYQRKMYDWSDVCNPQSLTLSNLLNGFIKHITPMQFTGFKDMYGKEIYEGDILENHLGRIVEMYWHKHSGQWDYRALNSLGAPTHFISKTPMNTRVIGNIYENPELL